MAEIKFRYKDESGVHYLTPPKYNGSLVMADENGKNYFVAEKELDMLVGYDADGKEVYEVDILIDSDGHEWEAIILPQVEMRCGGVYENLYNPKCKFRLKGTTDET